MTSANLGIDDPDRLWGNPSHLDYVASSLKQRHEGRLHILCAKANSGNYTYDGIETGGERVAHEIEETMEALEKEGQKITKLSVVGYSLGGLIARYAIGLLNSQGWLDKVQPVNFTTFASPHVGVRTPLKGISGHIWNELGARTVSISGQQLFMIDSFRDTGRPLLSVLADPESIFIQGLKKFKNRSVYANMVNDRSVVFYTAGLSKVDPFYDLENMNINYVEDYDRVIVNPDQYLLPPTPEDPETASYRLWKRSKSLVYKVPLYMLVSLLIAPASTVFLAYAAVQTYRSRERIRLHREGKNGKLFGRYRVPLLVQDVQHAMEEVIENVGARQEPDYLSTSEAEQSSSATLTSETEANDAVSMQSSKYHSIAEDHTSEHPTLALTPEQFAIIDSLNAVGFRKYPVYIHNHRHSHAAIIVRVQKKGFDEGKLIIKHWLDNEFAI